MITTTGSAPAIRTASTRMFIEAREAPEVVARLNGAAMEIGLYHELGARLRETMPPTSILTIARGSSDHAAQYFAYLVMKRLGRLVTSLPMSVVTLYQSRLRTEGLLSLAFSQSGQSPDLVSPTEYFSNEGATTVAFVNDTTSPLARAARIVFPLHAGREESVAATKSFIAQLAAGAHLVASWQGDTSLGQAIGKLPEALASAISDQTLGEWTEAVDVLAGASRLFVIGRGLGLPVAMEAALKLKETCAIQAEAFSGAEVKHGPMALIEEGYPLLIFAPRGPAQAGLIALADEMRSRGARVLLAVPPEASRSPKDLPLVDSADPDLDAITTIQTFYGVVEAVARARGADPDRPRHLAKVTRTK